MSFNKIGACLIGIIVFANICYANNPEIIIGGRIYGKITTADNKPAEEVTVILKAGRKINTTITNEDGFFEFTGLSQGNYQIEISYIGHASLKKDLVLQKGGNLLLAFQLKIQSKQLQDVIVAAKQKRLYIGKMNIPDRDLPLSVGIINNYPWR